MAENGIGGNLEITICGDIVNEQPSVIRGTLGAPYEVCKKIDKAIIKVLGGIRKDQTDMQPGSLLVLLCCFTDQKFFEVVEDIESGVIKQNLEQELLRSGIETEGLVVNIRNEKEVEEKKAAIDRRKVNTENMEIEGATRSGTAVTSPQIIVQGGAYFHKPQNIVIDDDYYLNEIKNAAKKGNDILMDGGTAVDAVEAAVLVLEDSEYFNAGRGSLLNNDREVECDAMIMDGSTLKHGAVISGRHFRNPVFLAKQIMKDTLHCALSGEGALKFAVEKGLPIADQTELISEHARKLRIPYSKLRKYIAQRYRGRPTEVETSDTVSAVARDKYGNFACATSTGGVPGRLAGRVSDASLVGCGGYANKHGAATTSGLGESLMKLTLARQVVYSMESGMNAQVWLRNFTGYETLLYRNYNISIHSWLAIQIFHCLLRDSAEEALKKMEGNLDPKGLGGVVAIDEHGNFGLDFGTEIMAWASIMGNTLKFGLRKNEVNEERLPQPL